MYSLFLFAFLCFSLIDAQCSDVAQQTSTLNPPSLDTATSSFSNNILTIGFHWGTTTTRDIVPVASLGSCSVTPAVIGVETNLCYYTETVAYDFALLTSVCGWSNLSSGAVLTYGGPLTLSALETYLDSRGATVTRNLTYTMEMSVTFPAFATSNTTVEIFSAVLLDVLVTSQIYVTASKQATIVFSTVVGYPFKVSIVDANGVTVTGSTPSTGFTMTVAPNAAPPTFGTTQGSTSSQPWDLVITPDPGACFFTGTYNLSAAFIIECALANVSDCPPINDNIINVSLSVKSESFCFQIASYVSVAATLVSYSDPALLIPATNYLVNDQQTTYFRMTVTSTSVTITNIDIQTIILQASGNYLNASGALTNTVNLYSAATWQNPNVAGTLSANTNNGGVQTFNFATNNFLFAVPLDTSTSIIVQVNATVSYLGGKKRAMLSSFAVTGTQNQILSSTIQLSGSNDGYRIQLSFGLFFALLLLFSF